MYKYFNVQQRVPVYHFIPVTTFKMCNSLPTICFYKFNFHLCSQHLFRSLCKRILQTTAPPFSPCLGKSRAEFQPFGNKLCLILRALRPFSRGAAYRAVPNTCSQGRNSIGGGRPPTGAMVVAGPSGRLGRTDGHGKPQKHPDTLLVVIRHHWSQLVVSSRFAGVWSHQPWGRSRAAAFTGTANSSLSPQNVPVCSIAPTSREAPGVRLCPAPPERRPRARDQTAPLLSN